MDSVSLLKFEYKKRQNIKIYGKYVRFFFTEYIKIDFLYQSVIHADTICKIDKSWFNPPISLLYLY